MNLFCRIFGHTWWPEIEVPHIRWNTTKDMQVLAASVEGATVRHFESCKRCGATRDVGPRSHDSDRPNPESEPAPEPASAE